jgi:hypothetical protein
MIFSLIYILRRIINSLVQCKTRQKWEYSIVLMNYTAISAQSYTANVTDVSY